MRSDEHAWLLHACCTDVYIGPRVRLPKQLRTRRLHVFLFANRTAMRQRSGELQLPRNASHHNVEDVPLEVNGTAIAVDRVGDH